MENGKLVASLTERALRCRERIIRFSSGGGCFIGASLSCIDVLLVLYETVIGVEKVVSQAADRDRFILSKGHDVPALYSLFMELGMHDKRLLEEHLRVGSSVYWHPNAKVRGVEFHSGSLGHGPAVGFGMAYASRVSGDDANVVVMVGDGELNEGSVWETIQVVAAKKMDNYWLVVDRNGFQANLPTEDLIPLEPLEDKFRSFGFAVARCNGHSFSELLTSVDQLRTTSGPKCLIADTVRGKGLPSIENRVDRWFAAFTEDEVESLLAELNGQAKNEWQGGQYVR
jgi:transketolase